MAGGDRGVSGGTGWDQSGYQGLIHQRNKDRQRCCCEAGQPSVPHCGPYTLGPCHQTSSSIKPATCPVHPSHSQRPQQMGKARSPHSPRGSWDSAACTAKVGPSPATAGLTPQAAGRGTRSGLPEAPGYCAATCSITVAADVGKDRWGCSEAAPMVTVITTLQPMHAQPPPSNLNLQQACFPPFPSLGPASSCNWP